MQDDYFQTSAEDKVEAKIQTLTSSIQKVAGRLDMNNLISSETVKSECMWEKN